jgi:hypothetical protein
MDVIVTIDADRVMVQQNQKQGFPTRNAAVPPLSEPAPYMFYATDRLIGLAPVQGHRAEFIRRPRRAPRRLSGPEDRSFAGPAERSEPSLNM